MKQLIKKWFLPLVVLFIAVSIFNMSKISQNQKKTDMHAIETGDLIPEFTLPDQNGVSFDIKSVIGKKKLVIYFYPKDDSPGCTKEAL
jgi:peroxiredoxin Q/BCP